MILLLHLFLYHLSLNKNQQMKAFIVVFLLSTSILISTYGQEKELGLVFSHQVNGQQLILGETVFPIWNGKKILLKRAEFYLSGFKVKNEGGNEITFPDTYLLLNAGEPSRRIVIGNVPSDGMSRLSMSIGIDSIKNHADPTLYPSSHPLGLKEPSMHWGWAGGYRFMAIEGLLDFNGDGTPETLFEYHNLGDALYKETIINVSAAYNSGNEITLPITLDYAKLFDQNTMIGTQIVHGSSARNLAMVNNAVNKGFFTLAAPSSIPSVDAMPWDVKFAGGEIYVNAGDCASCKVELTDLSGKSMGGFVLDAAGQGSMRSSGNATGLLIATLHSPNGTDSRMLVIHP